MRKLLALPSSPFLHPFWFLAISGAVGVDVDQDFCSGAGMHRTMCFYPWVGLAGPTLKLVRMPGVYMGSAWLCRGSTRAGRRERCEEES